MTATYPIIVTIDSVDRTAQVLAESVYIQRTRGNTADICTFTVRDTTEGNWEPVGWDEVTIDVDGVGVFGGYIVRKESYPVGTTSRYERRHWEVECQSWVVLFDTTIVERGYLALADTAIIADLFDTYLSGESIDYATQVDALTGEIQKMRFQRVTLREAFDKLAEYAHAEWWIDQGKVFWWHDASNAPAAPFDINTIDPAGVRPLHGTMRRVLDESTVVNEVKVVRMRVNSETQEDVFSGTGAKVDFGPLSKEPISIDYIEWTRAGGANATSSIGLDPHDRLTTEGGQYIVVANMETWTFRMAVAPDNSTDVRVQYHYFVPYELTYTDSASVTKYGRTFSRSFVDNTTWAYDAEADEFGAEYLALHANGKETVEFDVTTMGLVPGMLLTIIAPTADINVASDTTHEILVRGVGAADAVLRTYIVQAVRIHPIPAGGTGGENVMVASVSVGAWRPNLVSALQALSHGRSLSGGGGSNVATMASIGATTNRSNLGDVSSGRLAFTTTPGSAFKWDTFGSASGVVIGLDDSSGTATGNLLMLEGGTVRAQVGLVTGRANIGTVVPSGWGIWTNNGYFSGEIAASTIHGGTVLGQTLIGGTIATSTPPINSGNPGVIITAAGLVGFGSIGETFNLPSDGAPPTFSSGTIKETVYEIYTAGVIRTAADPSSTGGVQMDSSGVYGWNSGGTQTFALGTAGGLTLGDPAGNPILINSATGVVTVPGTIIAGTISAVAITASTFTGGTVQSTGGSAALTDDGLKFLTGSGATLQKPRAVWWADGANTVGYLQTSDNTSINRVQLVADNDNGQPGNVYIEGHGIGGTARLIVDPDTFILQPRVADATAGAVFIRGAEAQFSGSAVTKDVIPATTNFYQLGNTANGWTKLVLHDGTDEWEVTVDTGGNLITTKV